MDALTPARPDGPLLWLHVPRGEHGPPLEGVLDRLRAEGLTATLALSGEASGAIADEPEPIARLLLAWRPDAVLWVGQVEHPLLLDQIGRAGLPLLLLDARSPDRSPSHGRRVQRMSYSRFTRILA